MKRLDHNIKEHYSHQYCPKHIVSKLLKKYPCPAGDCSIWQKISSVAALLLIAFLGYTSIGYVQAQCSITQMITIQDQNIPMTIRPHSISRLKADLPKLNFLPQSLPKNLDEKYEVLGARYCKIKGTPVANLQVVDKKSGQLYSLYISPQRRQSFYPMSSQVKKHTVKTWSEDKLSFTLINLV